MIESPDTKSNLNKEEFKSYSDSKITNIKHIKEDDTHQQSISEYAMSYRESEHNNLNKFRNSINSINSQNYHVEITIDENDVKKSISPAVKNDDNLSCSLDASVDENYNVTSARKRNDYLLQVILFVNPNSGSREAKIFINKYVKKMSYSDLGVIFILNLLENNSFNIGANIARDIQKKGGIPKVVIAGGDGTFSPIVEYFCTHSINMARIHFCILPFGTGNDLAQITGWGSTPGNYATLDFMESIKLILSEIQRAIVDTINMWDVTVTCKNKGDIFLVNRENGKQLLGPWDSNIFHRKMVNYSSLGVDARIGLDFEKFRTGFATCNKVIYGYQSILHTCCTKTSRMNDVIESIYIMHPEAEQAKQANNENNTKKNYKNEETISLKDFVNNPSVLLFTNIPSYMAGHSNPWGGALNSGYSKLKDNKQKGKQKINDNVIEIVTYENPVSLPLECLCGSQAKKIAREEYGFEIDFKKNKKKEDCPIITYLNIDGEYYLLHNPQNLTVKLAENCSEGKIYLLFKNQLSI